MRRRKIAAFMAISALTVAMTCQSGVAASSIIGGGFNSYGSVMEKGSKTNSNHFKAYTMVNGVQKTRGTIYEGSWCFAHVDVEGDDLSQVSYNWKMYWSNEDYEYSVAHEEEDYGMDIGNYGSTLVYDSFSEGDVIVCEVSDGLGNTQSVVFDYVVTDPSTTGYVNLYLPAGQSLDLASLMEGYDHDGTSYSDWMVATSDPNIISADEGVIKCVTPGVTNVWIWTNQDSEEDDWMIRSFCLRILVQFKDVTDQKAFWYEPVYWGTERGIVKGYDNGTFKPANDCTRSQMVTFLWRLAGEPEPETTVSPFKDVTDPETYFYKAVLWGSEKGIVNGYKLKDGTQEFRPTGKCTRQQAVTFLWRYANEPEPSSTESSFMDVQDENTYFYKAVLWAAENGITTGYDDQTFKPTGNCLRRQMVTFLCRYQNYEDSHQTVLPDDTIVIGDWWTDPYAEPTSEYDKDWKEFQQSNMKTYDYQIVRKSITSWYDLYDGFYQNQVASGECDASVYVLDPGCISTIDTEYFYDLATLDNLDLSDEKWNQKTIELMTRGDHVYGLSYGDSEPRLGVFFNKRLLKEAGFDENYLYDLQAEGKWTWEEFEKVCAACTKDKDGDGENDIYALASFQADYYPAVTASNGADWITRDADGHFVNNITSEEWMKSMNWGVDVAKKYEMPMPADSAWDWFIDAFASGQVAMTVAEAYKASMWANSLEDEWGFVMFPYGPDMDHCVQLVRDYVYVIPSCYSKEEAEEIAFAFDKWATVAPGYDPDESWAEIYYNDTYSNCNIGLFDDRAVTETFAEMRKPENQMVNYTNVIRDLNTGEIVFNVGPDAYSTLEEVVDLNKDYWDSLVEAENNKF